MLNMSSSLSTKGQYEGKLIMDVSTFTYNPLKDPTVIQALSDSTLFYVLCVIAFCFVGASYVIISQMRPARQFLGMDSGVEYPLTKYISHALILIVTPAILPMLMFTSLIFNYVICQMIMSNILPSILLSPSNTTLYVAMTFIYMLLAVAFVWRTLIIGISVACCLIIFLLTVIPYTRHIGTTLIEYYLLMVFMQPVILLTTSIGVGVIQFIVPFDQTGQMFGFMVLGLLLLTVSVLFVLGPMLSKMIFRKTKKTLRLVL